MEQLRPFFLPLFTLLPRGVVLGNLGLPVTQVLGSSPKRPKSSSFRGCAAPIHTCMLLWLRSDYRPRR